MFKFWVADWFAMLNKKLGGDLEKIRTVGRYMIEVWKAAGMDMRNVQFLWASDHINSHSDAYWGLVMDIATRFNLPRIMRCNTIMGRKDSEELAASQVFYPCMQCADVFYLKADICQLGMDQRKVNMLAREYCDLARPKIATKPVILSHGMLMGLKEGQEKMSKSDPDSAIFMEDTAADVKRKIKRAYCPEGISKDNPVLDWCKNIVFRKFGSFTIKRTPENGGDLYVTFCLCSCFCCMLHPDVLAQSVQVLRGAGSRLCIHIPAPRGPQGRPHCCAERGAGACASALRQRGAQEAAGAGEEVPYHAVGLLNAVPLIDSLICNVFSCATCGQQGGSVSVPSPPQCCSRPWWGGVLPLNTSHPAEVKSCLVCVAGTGCEGGSPDTSC